MAVASVPEADFDAWTRLECDQSGGLSVEFQRTPADLFDVPRDQRPGDLGREHSLTENERVFNRILRY